MGDEVAMTIVTVTETSGKPTVTSVVTKPRRKKSELRRSGSVAIQRMKSDVDQHKGSDLHGLSLLNQKAEERMANVLANAKRQGLASSRTVAGMAAFSKASFIDDDQNVAHHSKAVQKNFRCKLLGALILQLTFLNMIVYMTIVPGLLRTTMDGMIGSNNWRVTTMLLLFISLGIIYWFKYKHPLASALLFVWTMAAGVGIGVMSLYASSYGFIQILLYVYFSVLGMLLLSRLDHNALIFCKHKPDSIAVSPEDAVENGDVHTSNDECESPLVTCFEAGMISYFVVFIIALLIQIMFPEGRSPYHFVTCIVFSFIVVAWMSYDADLMHYKMSPGEWCQGPVFFWADLLVLFSMCCILCACLCMGGGNDSGGGGMDSGADVGVDNSDALQGGGGNLPMPLQ